MAPLLLIALFALPGPPPGLVKGYQARSTSTGAVYSRGWSDRGLDWVERTLPRALAQAEQRLGRTRGRPFQTVLVDSHAELRRLVRGLGGREPAKYTQGVAFPSWDLLIVRREVLLAMRPENSAGVTLTHEIAHLVLHRREGTNLSRWLDEGLAMWASQGSLSRRDDSYLSLLARTGCLYRLQSLEDGFPAEHRESSIAYQESLLMVLFLVSRHGEEGIHRLLDWVEGGQSCGEALTRLTGLSRDALEERFFAWVATRRSLVEAAVSLLSIWTLASLLALAAIGRYLWRRRRALRALEAEER